jgi:murein L,D-transpeptidase YafK
MIKSIFIPFLVLIFPINSFHIMNTPSPADTFKQTQKKYSRVKAAYADHEEDLNEELIAKGYDLTNINILIFATKQEREFNVYIKKKSEKKYEFFKTYDFCYLSGILGPKRKEGDLQVPEGFYYVNGFNPNSQYHLSLKINYPNASDKILSDKKAPGGEIFIHGKCVSIGCVPLTDEKINELYILAVEATNNGQSKIPVYIFPFKMNDETMTLMEMLLDDEKLISFWKNLKEGYDKFLENKTEITVKVDAKGKYLY